MKWIRVTKGFNTTVTLMTSDFDNRLKAGCRKYQGTGEDISERQVKSYDVRGENSRYPFL